MAERQDLCARSFQFACDVLQFYRRVAKGDPGIAQLGRQLLDAGTSLGANIEEAKVATSRRDMAAKYAIALWEARESRYWLRLLSTDGSFHDEAEPLINEASEFVAMLTVSVRKLRQARIEQSDRST